MHGNPGFNYCILSNFCDTQSTHLNGYVVLYSYTNNRMCQIVYKHTGIKIKISSTRVQHKVGSRDEIRWSPNIIGQWIARVPADHAWRTITRADEMKRNGWDECGEMVDVICDRVKREKPREKPTQSTFHELWNPHGETKTRTRVPSGGRRETARFLHEAALLQN